MSQTIRHRFFHGLDATNRLAAIMRGDSYMFFINDQCVGVYHGDGPAEGQVGLYVECRGTVGFRDFAVYSTPPPSPLLPV